MLKMVGVFGEVGYIFMMLGFYFLLINQCLMVNDYYSNLYNGGMLQVEKNINKYS